uniref:Nuclear respiratory factor 1 NLS/DNA-binding dimerisation domain-containing protein n=1 Tax=Glossina brevipalpis TaxID=37001 RepID=A0A1A9W357_9MUSC
MDEHEEFQQKIILNLPLLFVGVYPTYLEKITESQLETFIPLMVQSSLNKFNLPVDMKDCIKPEWWPDDLSFSFPLIKPKEFKGSWLAKLKDIVQICYEFHKSILHPKFSNKISMYEQASLRFISRYNFPTSLCDRKRKISKTTFRNETISYDQIQGLRKLKNDPQRKNGIERKIMAPFDINQRDNCAAELYSDEVMLKHGKSCRVQDEVILNATSELANIDNIKIDSNNVAETNELRIQFLMNFNLKYKSKHLESPKTAETLKVSTLNQWETKLVIPERNGRRSQRNRTMDPMLRSLNIPFSSLKGQLLLRTTKEMVTCQYLNERLEYIEVFCHAPILSEVSSWPKYFRKNFFLRTPSSTFKKPAEYSSHLYVFPRRQFSQKRQNEIFNLLNSTLLRRCRSMSIRMVEMEPNHSKIDIKLNRNNPHGSGLKISSSPSERIILETINLCTSDEEDDFGMQPMPLPLILKDNNLCCVTSTYKK